MNEADYIIIGAGPAGAALSARLAASPLSPRIILVEAGGGRPSLLSQVPAGIALRVPFRNGENYALQTVPQPGLQGRRGYVPRGRGLGGSSLINAMIYVRGQPEDYDHWASLGCAGWCFADVLPLFKRAEANLRGADAWHGAEGPLIVSDLASPSPVSQDFIQAALACGLDENPDFNGPRQEGIGLYQVFQKKGRRLNAARAYLGNPPYPAHLEVLTKTRALRIVITEGRATGVVVHGPGGERRLEARREVILCGGAIASPQLLMLSGIGPAAHLNEMGIPVVADRPGVGQNLQDHLEYYHQFRASQPITLHSRNNWFWKGVVGAEWLFFKTGLGTSNQFEAAAFIRSSAGVKWPDIQYHFLPIAVSYDGKSAADGHGFQAHVGYNMSKSRGAVTLRSPDVKDAPVLRFNYMSDPEDWVKFRHAVRVTREIFAQPAFAPYMGGEIAPGPKVQSDEEIDAFLREHLEGAYHPCGTCRMGRESDPMAVVDPTTRVIGVEGLRVADSSIFPHVTYGNLNGPSIMTGEKAADHILGRQPLPRSNQEPWINPNWQVSDR